MENDKILPGELNDKMKRYHSLGPPHNLKSHSHIFYSRRSDHDMHVTTWRFRFLEVLFGLILSETK